MSIRATEKMKANNELYTQECKNIYYNLSFAHVRRVELWSGMLYCIYGFFFVILAALMGAYIIPVLAGKIKRGIPYDLISAILILGFIIALSIATLFCVKSYRDKSYQFYLLKNQNGEYEIETQKIGDKVYIKEIIDMKKYKALSIEGNKCTIIDCNAIRILSKGIGFYQYLVPPTKVYLNHEEEEDSIYLYKKKTVAGNKVYYRFASFGGVIGARYSRCIKLKEGVIKYITTQETYGLRHVNYGKVIFTNYKYIYNHVNDSNVKIYVPRYVWEYAKKHKFVLPTECENICIEE